MRSTKVLHSPTAKATCLQLDQNRKLNQKDRDVMEMIQSLAALVEEAESKPGNSN
jgi:hypothetical protein